MLGKNLQPWKQLACVNDMFLKHVIEDKSGHFFKGVSWLLKVQTQNEKNTYSIQNVFFLPTDNVGTSISQGHDKKQKYPQAPMFLFNIVSQFIISSQGV